MSDQPTAAPEPHDAGQPAPPPAPSATPSAPPAAAVPQGDAWSGPPRPAGPAPGVTFAPHGGRLVAYIIDSIIIIALVLAGSVVAAVPVIASQTAGAILATVVLFLLTVVVGIAYFPWFWARTGSTPGMRLFRLRVVRDRDGGPITAGTAILRLIGYWVSQTVFYIGFIWIFFDDRRRGWHDLIAGTVVIEDTR